MRRCWCGKCGGLGLGGHDYYAHVCWGQPDVMSLHAFLCILSSNPSSKPQILAPLAERVQSTEQQQPLHVPCELLQCQRLPHVLGETPV